MSSFSAQLEDLKRSALAQGWRYSKTSGGHHQFYAPNKHDIVTIAGTPSDHRGWHNAMASMRRAGYVEPNGDYKAPTLGDLLPKPTQAVEQPDPAATKPKSIPYYIAELLAKDPTRTYHLDEIRLYVRARRPTATDLAISQEASRIAKEGRIKRLGSGTYAHKEYTPARLAPVTPPATVQTPPPAQVPVDIPRVTDDTLAADIAALDKALAALGDIEGVVRRTQEKIAQLIALRKALGG